MTTSDQATATVETPSGPRDISLTITDPDVLTALDSCSSEREQHDFAVAALRIGVLALRQARGSLDADVLQHEGDRLLLQLKADLDKHQELVKTQVTVQLKEYFDPQSGRFSERVQQLVQKDGELDTLLTRLVGSEDSTLTRTLAAHFGEHSPLMTRLDPQGSDSILALIQKRVADGLSTQREEIVAQFSLDDESSALSRLVREVKENSDSVVKQFSLDDDDSALSRLVGRVTAAQRQISDEFSLDNDGSALSKMKGELLSVLQVHRKESQSFETEVKSTLAAMDARRKEKEASTRHGGEFESDMFLLLQERCQAAGNVATDTSNSTGLIKNNKKGDCVVKLGPEHRAAGAQIVFEAKQDASYDLKKALEEIDEARRNRDASVGVFVFSRRTAPAEIATFKRYGSDLVVVWDADDPESDMWLEASISVAEALATEADAQASERGVEREAIHRAVLDIEKQMKMIEEVSTSAGTIKSANEKILNRVRIVRDTVLKQVEVLRESLGGLSES